MTDPKFNNNSPCAAIVPADSSVVQLKQYAIEQIPIKNPEKWKQTAKFASACVGNSRLLPMKMPSDFEFEEMHTAETLLEAIPTVRAIIDLTNHETAAYRTSHLPVQYVKFQLEAKCIPTVNDVTRFVYLVRHMQQQNQDGLIAVHCHYGYNRTGFVVCSYLCEDLGYDVEDAISLFASVRPPGIRHQHFLDALRERYGKIEKHNETAA